MTDRRTFLKGTAAVGALAAITDMETLFAQEASPQAASGIPDLVAVRNGTRAEMVKKAVETLGGMQ
ncbi:MAG: twin-arginine translocation signal domain-containing protein, partial [Akkermansia sp.]